MWFAFPPTDGGGSPRKWTNNSHQARNDPDNYYYLPQVAIHEFGHTAGLAHPRMGANAVMGSLVEGRPLTEPTEYDLEGIKHLYE